MKFLYYSFLKKNFSNNYSSLNNENHLPSENINKESLSSLTSFSSSLSSQNDLRKQLLQKIENHLKEYINKFNKDMDKFYQIQKKLEQSENFLENHIKLFEKEKVKKQIIVIC